MVDRDLFTGQVVRLHNDSLNELNEDRAEFCSRRRYAKCVREDGCQAITPRNAYSENRLLGRKPPLCLKEVTARDRRRIARILRRQLDRCRRITITVEEGGAR